MDKIIYKNMLDDNSSENLRHCVDFVTEHRYELVLEGWTVCVLLDGIVDDGEDYYWRLIRPYDGVSLHSCVGRVDSLKGKIDNEVYEYIYNLFRMNYGIWYRSQRHRLESEYTDRDRRLTDSFSEMKEILEKEIKKPSKKK